MKSDILTIAIPVYERVDFFKEALLSALNQTIQVPVIVVDNASAHNEFEKICLLYKDRVKYYRNERNIGMFANWNKCVSLVDTKYVCILGDDDIMDPHFVEFFMKAYNVNSSLDVFYSNFFFLYESTNNKIISLWKNPFGWHDTKVLKKIAATNYLYFPTISCVIRTELLRKSPFITVVHASNDWWFIYNSLSDDTIFYGENAPLVQYRKHRLSDTNNESVIKNCYLSHLFILYNCLYVLNGYTYLFRKFLISFRLIVFSINNRNWYNNFLLKPSPYVEVSKSIFSMKNNIGLALAYPCAILYNIVKRVRKILWNGYQSICKK